MKKFNAILVGLLMSFVVMADPAPFGLEIGQATVEQMKKKYTATYKGVNKYSGGKMFDLPTAELGVSGLKEATAIFDQEGKLVAVLLTLPKRKFDSMHQSLSNKYRVTRRDIPFVGNKEVVYKDGATEVTLSAPHMSFDMSLNYINNAFYKSYLNKSRAEEAEKKQQEDSRL